jgi:RNA polymerase-interacting CarD/CdnL/TRCF family regulator
VKGPPVRHEEPKEQYPAVEGIIRDAAELHVADRVVYPNQGVCRITGIEKKEIAGQKLELVRMVREEDGAAVLVPKGKVPTVGLRKVASGEQMEGVFHYLAAQYDDPELDWKVRHRDNADRLIAGGVLGVAEVVKGLHSLSRIRPLPAKEREQYDNARHLLVHEVAVSLGVSPGLAEDYIDYALMPPAGVTFKLKPPPKPVELPSRSRRKVVRTDDEDDELGLDDLGLDLGELPASGEAAAGADALPDVGVLPEIPSADDIPAPDIEASSDELEPVGGVEDGADEDEEKESAPDEVHEAMPSPRSVKPAAKKVAPPVRKAPPSKPAAKKVEPKPAAPKKGKAPARKAPPAKPAAKKVQSRPAVDAKKEKAPAKKPAPKKAAKGKKK